MESGYFGDQSLPGRRTQVYGIMEIRAHLEAEVNHIPLPSDLVTSLSNKSSLIQPFILTLPTEYDPFQVLLVRTSHINWGFAAVYNYRIHDEHQSNLNIRDFL